ncbi:MULTISPECIES: VOC family protein [unclassified Streptomyces]|uniref:VOC family protein n=1 Tax=unclassified Streptomyces TaxID=2593676 RepID=UPI0010115ADF|nr:VOC family protein [Streptomyces sp. GZWMJZ-114]
MPPYLRPVAVTLDCADPLALAAFYREATGLAPHPGSGAGFAALTGPDGFVLGFQAVADYRPPRWPGQDVPQQVHLCYEVDEDLGAAEARLLALGAAVPGHQPHDPDHARVLTDPAGHPFCIVRKKRKKGKG